jgi:hypothetical protein
MLLTSTSDKIQVVTGSAANLDVHADWIDNLSGAMAPGRTNTPAITTAATTDVVGAPASSTQRKVKDHLHHQRRMRAFRATTVSVNAHGRHELRSR